ncbi:MAG: FliG C-terminal domain-containing protein [bacterium]
MAEELSGPQKAAVIIAWLDDTLAVEVLKQLSPEEIKSVAKEIAQLGNIPPRAVKNVLSEFNELMTEQPIVGNQTRATALLNQVMGNLEYSEIVGDYGGESDKKALEILQNADPFALLDAIKNDQPQTIAITLRTIPPAKASMILRDLPPETMEEVIKKMTKLDNVSSETVNIIAQSLRMKLRLATSKEEIRRSSGIGIASTIVSYIGGADAQNILKSIGEKDSDTANRMKDLIFTFDDIADMEDKALQQIIREIDRHTLVVALKGANEKIKNKILSNVSERAKEELMEEFETLGALRLAEIEESQRKVVEIIRRLDEEGKVTLQKKQ